MDAIVWQEGKPEGTIYCEHEPDEIDRFQRAGYRAEAATKKIDPGIAEVRKRLQPDGTLPVHDVTISTVWHSGNGDVDEPAGEAAAEDRVALLVSEQCEHLVREFLGYKEDHVGKDVADDHCLDGLRYACMGVAGRETVSATW